GGGADGVAHVMQTIENRDEVVVLSGILLGLGLLEREPIGNPFTLGRITSCLDRFVVIIEAEEVGLGKRFRHQHCGSTLPTSHVGDARAGFELFLYIMERGNPRAHQIGSVTGAEELLAPVKHAVIMLVPAHPSSIAK